MCGVDFKTSPDDYQSYVTPLQKKEVTSFSLKSFLPLTSTEVLYLPVCPSNLAKLWCTSFKAYLFCVFFSLN